MKKSFHMLHIRTLPVRALRTLLIVPLSLWLIFRLMLQSELSRYLFHQVEDSNTPPSLPDHHHEPSSLLLDATGHSKIIYGHIHMPKTGGTSLNGILANQKERICGHKGYSYDAFQANERFQPPKQILDTQKIPWDPSDRVLRETMSKIGFEDCDWISHETHWIVWTQSLLPFAERHNLTLELHLPCRDPLEHLLSMCNHQGRTFECHDTGNHNSTLEQLWIQSIEHCMLFTLPQRFGRKFVKKLNEKHVSLQCYPISRQFTHYLERYLMPRLQPRRITAEYKRRESNIPRNKTAECLLSNQYQTRAEFVRQYLREHYPYFQFCQECLGSERDLTRDLKEEDDEPSFATANMPKQQEQ